MRTSNEGRSLSPLKVCTPLHNNTEVGIPELYYIKEMWYDKTPIQQKSLKWCFSNYKSRFVFQSLVSETYTDTSLLTVTI